MDNFVLISFYDTGDHTPERWRVCGHRGLCDNEVLAGFPLKSQVLEYCHEGFRLPVVQGQGAKLDEVIERLTLAITCSVREEG